MLVPRGEAQPGACQRPGVSETPGAAAVRPGVGAGGPGEPWLHVQTTRPVPATWRGACHVHTAFCPGKPPAGSTQSSQAPVSAGAGRDTCLGPGRGCRPCGPCPPAGASHISSLDWGLAALYLGGSLNRGYQLGGLRPGLPTDASLSDCRGQLGPVRASPFTRVSQEEEHSLTKRAKST